MNVYTVQENELDINGSLIAWTEGVYPSYAPYHTSYIYEWVLYNNGACQQWSLQPPANPDPVLAFAKTAFSYLAIYGDTPYTDALVNAVVNAGLATSQGFGEAVCGKYGQSNGQPDCGNGVSAQSLWPASGANSNGFFSDKTQEQVLDAAFYVITHSPTFVPLNHIVSVVSAGAGSVWFVLPDFTAGEPGSMHTSAAKCGGHVAALATDVYSATYLFGALTVPQQNEVLDTNSAYVSQSDKFMRETHHSYISASRGDFWAGG